MDEAPNFQFVKGDKVRLSGSDLFVTITAVGETTFIGRSDWGEGEGLYRNAARWERYVEPPPPIPERWLNVYERSMHVLWHSTREAADEAAARAHRHTDANRIAVIHVHPDRTVTVEEP